MDFLERTKPFLGSSTTKAFQLFHLFLVPDSKARNDLEEFHDKVKQGLKS